MINKINGIDVSECKNFSCGMCEEENKIPKTIEHFTTDCVFYPNCYYKQLKRSERENKEKINILEQIINILYPNANDDELYDVAFNSEYIDKLKELIKLNERLQEENKRLQMLSCANCGEEYLSPTGAELYEKNVQLQKENEELKKQIKKQKKCKNSIKKFR